MVGLPNNNHPDFSKTHTPINDVYYGITCEKCGLFPVAKVKSNDFGFGCTNCWCSNNPDKMYRFIPKAYETAEFAHIFNESEHKFGDGQDGYIEDVGKNEYGYLGWDNPANKDTDNSETPEEDPAELSFRERIVQFFTKIGLWFANLFAF